MLSSIKNIGYLSLARQMSCDKRMSFDTRILFASALGAKYGSILDAPANLAHSLRRSQKVKHCVSIPFEDRVVSGISITAHHCNPSSEFSEKRVRIKFEIPDG